MSVFSVVISDMNGQIMISLSNKDKSLEQNDLTVLTESSLVWNQIRKIKSIYKLVRLMPLYFFSLK